MSRIYNCGGRENFTTLKAAKDSWHISNSRTGKIITFEPQGFDKWNVLADGLLIGQITQVELYNEGVHL